MSKYLVHYDATGSIAVTKIVRAIDAVILVKNAELIEQQQQQQQQSVTNTIEEARSLSC